MHLFHRVLRAEYLWRPSQVCQRALDWARGRHRRASAEVGLPWGLAVTVDPRETIGRSLLALHSLDLPVTETIWRLLDPGDLAVDAGANLGAMTSAMAARLAAGGTVHAFEPVPALADLHARASARWRGLSRADVRLHRVALSDADGTARLLLPADYAANHGLARLLSGPAKPLPPGAAVLDVPTRRLESVLGADARIGVMKLDVEGAEAAVLRGAGALLREHRIRDLVLEEHGDPANAESFGEVRRAGYRIFRVTRGWLGPRLLPPEARPAGEIDPPTFLATCDAARAGRRFAPRGWSSLRPPARP